MALLLEDKKWIVRVLYLIAELIVFGLKGDVAALRRHRPSFEREVEI